MPKNVLSREQLFKLGDLLRQHCHKTEAGFSEYDEPWTDELIAEKLGSPFAKHHVSHLRTQLLGKFSPTTNILNQYQLKDYILELTKRVDHLQSHIERLEKWAAARPVVPFKDE